MKRPVQKRMVISWLLLPFIGILFSLFFNLLLQALHVFTGVSADEALLRYFSDMTWLLAVIQIFLAPFLEELLFRKLLYGALKKRLNPIFSAIVTSVLFAVLHFDLIQAIYAFLFSMLLIEIMERLGTYYAAVAVHTAANLFSVFMNLTPAADQFVNGHKFWFLGGSALALFAAVLAFEKLTGRLRNGKEG